MMELKKISELAKILKQNQLTKLDLTEGDVRLVLESAGGKVVLQEMPKEIEIFQEETTITMEEKKLVVESTSAYEQKSPLVGTVYLAPQAGSAPYVKVGDKVKKGDPVCIVESMKMFNTIEAEKDGEVVAVPVDNGQIVEYGQVLVCIREEA
ncbi:Biotin carboxyl carrier protein of acetyl-CoA carboxylase [bioreactor metagenome]|uniref:Biotin carboxyl carrier protein of acetyl-CoA carboxylase n=2 Tax=root TaxID=1 RepID=A0A120MK62_ANAPI|nr:acetyl-CoA carboxylase biotin carboxyl carrier protein [Anaerotignum propionicum]AMJ40258.1 biotin carboxyl carrier protein of acetyl-CoA carboxylase [Anaerotignum propionicum DSM 1682]MEA5057499.1 acetyl-CoA carboxylase biotin carboxyl carrier protein [Anaerotignum propionicum]SHE46427.1 acetyl-CoA carboxylase biotin carboxyl carrier protein [[Clostridium] propionicum DSM 1682] [Anaerotignum propionicum DSM 1682]